MLGLLPAFIIGLAVDAVFLGERTFVLPLVPVEWIPELPVAQLRLSILILLAATSLGAVVSWIEDWCWSVFAQRIQRSVRVDAYAGLQRQELQYFTRRRTGDLMSVLNSDINALETFLKDGLSATFWILATVGGIGVILATLNLPLTVLTLLPIPVLAAFTLLFTRVIEPRYLSVREEIGELSARLENSISGIETIKTQHAEEFEVERLRDAAEDYLRAQLSAVRAQITYFPGLSVISGVGFAATFLVGGFWVLEIPVFGLYQPLAPGEFVTFLIYAQQFVWPIIRLGDVVDDYERAKTASIRIDAVLSRKPRIRDATTATPLVITEGAVSVDDVTFGYAERETLREIYIEVPGGDTVGIVGPTGAGKSTLLKLLARLYDTDAGEIRIDGQDIREVTIESLRRSIGYVSQEPFLFFGTVRENIRYGSFDATDREVERAARHAQVHEFVRRLPDGYDTLVGERGVKLSAGQRQRITIARTILKDPPILLLDEATSALDTETEALIQSSLGGFTTERTTFVVAHRLSTVRHADRILVLDDGAVVEDGTHRDLLSENGLYANLWRVQIGDIGSLPSEFLRRALQRETTPDRDE